MINPYKFTPKRDWILVLDTPRRTSTVGGILLPTAETGVEKVTEGTGMIIAVGPGIKNDKLQLSKGLKIVYRAYLKHAERIPYQSEGEEKIFFLMSSDDIMGIVSPGVDVGVFSGRPQVPESN